MRSSKTVRALVESAMLVALATVLSIIKIIEMPYGGSVTVASSLPIIILAYRHGLPWGLGGGLAYAVLQQLLGLNNLSYVTGWQSVVAVIALDYIIAFTVMGLGGIFKSATGSQRLAITLGALLVSVLRYVCHVISGCTVWAGLSIPTEAAFIYSIGYNATYMLPETIILVATAYYLSDALDFTRPVPARRISKEKGNRVYGISLLGGLSLLVGLIVDVVLIAPSLQDAETGEFIFSGIKNANLLAVAIVSAVSVLIGISLIVIAKVKEAKKVSVLSLTENTQ